MFRAGITKRGLSLETAGNSPSGKQYVEFRNDVIGKPSWLLRFAVDGSAVKRLKVTATIKCRDVVEGQAKDELPVVLVQFFDAKRERRQLMDRPFRGTQRWKTETKTINVPVWVRKKESSDRIIRSHGFGVLDNIHIEGEVTDHAPNATSAS
ncbi:MAG: hypothetical protein U0892_17680 [Pirellulales bacterium]